MWNDGCVAAMRGVRGRVRVSVWGALRISEAETEGTFPFTRTRNGRGLCSAVQR